MNMKELFGSALGRAGEAVSAARETAQERLVVVGGWSPSLSLKWALVVILVAFGGGVYAGVKWDFARFAEFRVKADALNEQIKAENAKLAAELETLRRQIDAEESQRSASDADFVNVINKPSANSCSVPVGPLNALIVEASR